MSPVADTRVMKTDDAQRMARARLRQRARRASSIRRRVAALAVSAFALLFGGIYATGSMGQKATSSSTSTSSSSGSDSSSGSGSSSTAGQSSPSSVTTSQS